MEGNFELNVSNSLRDHCPYACSLGEREGWLRLVDFGSALIVTASLNSYCCEQE